MSVITSAKITNEQKRFIEDNSINFSKFVRKQINTLMEKNQFNDYDDLRMIDPQKYHN